MKNNIYALIIISFDFIDDANWFSFIKLFKRLLKFIDFNVVTKGDEENERVKGEIMKVGYTFACFMTKKTVFSQVIQLPTYKSIFFI